MTTSSDNVAPEESTIGRAIDILARSGLTLAGRTFFPAGKEVTADQHMWTWTRLTKSGIGAIAATLDLTREEALSEFASQVLVSAYDSGQMWELLAGTIVEEGVPWSKDGARANAALFAGVTDPDEHKALMGALSGVLLSFLLRTAAANLISLKSGNGHDMTRDSRAPSKPSQLTPRHEPIAEPHRDIMGSSPVSLRKSLDMMTPDGAR